MISITGGGCSSSSVDNDLLRCGGRRVGGADGPTSGTDILVGGVAGVATPGTPSDDVSEDEVEYSCHCKCASQYPGRAYCGVRRKAGRTGCSKSGSKIPPGPACNRVAVSMNSGLGLDFTVGVVGVLEDLSFVLRARMIPADTRRPISPKLNLTRGLSFGEGGMMVISGISGRTG